MLVVSNIKQRLIGNLALTAVGHILAGVCVSVMLMALALVLWTAGHQVYIYLLDGQWLPGNLASGFPFLVDPLLVEAKTPAIHGILYFVLVELHVAVPAGAAFLVMGGIYLMVKAGHQHLQRNLRMLRTLSISMLRDDSSGVPLEADLIRKYEPQHRFRRSTIH